VANRLAAALAVALFGCCAEPSAPLGEAKLPISGGEAVAPGAWPMVVWLDNGCSGVLLQRDLVVYAAHCGEQAENVWLGDTVDLVVDEVSQTVTTIGSPDGRAFPVSWCRSDPDYQVAAGNDEAFCVLAGGGITDFIGVAPSCDSPAVGAGAEATLVGFGYGEEKGRAPGVKRSTRAEVVGIGREILIGDERHGTCAGDSGSPAFIRGATEWKLLGLLSTGLSGATCGAGYYTSIDTVVRWVEGETDRSLGSCDGSSAAPESPCPERFIDEDGSPQPISTEASAECHASRSSHPADSGCAIGTWRAGDADRMVPLSILCLLTWAQRRRRSHQARHQS
jgi:hypothetical protein